MIATDGTVGLAEGIIEHELSATGGYVGLAEWIFHGSCSVESFYYLIKVK